MFKVDVDKNIELAEKYNVLSVTTFMIFKIGEIVDSFSCGMEQKRFEQTAENMLDI